MQVIRLGSQVVCEYKVRVITLCHGLRPEAVVQHQMRSDNGQEWYETVTYRLSKGTVKHVPGGTA